MPGVVLDIVQPIGAAYDGTFLEQENIALKITHEHILYVLGKFRMLSCSTSFTTVIYRQSYRDIPAVRTKYTFVQTQKSKCWPGEQ